MIDDKGYGLYNELSEQDEKKLEELNESVEKALEERKEWLDKKMSEYARIKIGEDLYDVSTGRILGKVTKYYRYHEGKSIDNKFKIHCEYQRDPRSNSFDNTSRNSGISFGTHDDAIRSAKIKYHSLRKGKTHE